MSDENIPSAATPEPDAVPPHLLWSPIREAYPPRTFLVRMGFGVISLGIFLGLGVLGVFAMNRRVANLRAAGLGFQLNPESVVYTISNGSDGRPYDPEGGGGKEEPTPPVQEGATREATERWKDVMDMMAAEAPDAPQDDEAAARAMLQPGAIQVSKTPSSYVTTYRPPTGPTEKNGGGTGGGSGSGEGSGSGNGHGTNPNFPFLADGSGNGIPMRMDELTINYQEDPVYPTNLKMSGTEGGVLVRITINEWGNPVHTEIKSAANPQFAAEVVRVLPHWRFKPVKVNGRAVRISVIVLFDFRLIKNGKGS